MIERGLVLKERLQNGVEERTPERYVREELIEILKQGRGVLRFKSDRIPDGLIEDNVYEHTLRCVAIAQTLGFAKDIEDELCRCLILHDLPEIVSVLRMGLDHDITAPEKDDNRELQEEVESIENQTAREIFDKEELELFRRFEKMHEEIRREGEESVRVSKDEAIAMLACVIDSTDGHIVLHQQVSEKFKKGLGVPESVIENGLAYARFQLRVFTSNLWKQDQEDISIVTSQELLRKLILTIEENWEGTNYTI